MKTKWTKTRPTKTGWYWFRNDTHWPRPIFVSANKTIAKVKWYGDDIDVCQLNGEWQGPITPKK